MVTERRRWRHGSDDARKTAGAGPSPHRDRAARARLPAVASGTASLSATAAGLAETIGIHAEQKRGRSPANARISGTACHRTPRDPTLRDRCQWFQGTSGWLDGETLNRASYG